MRDESDYTEYASARWQTLLRAAVFLGCSAHEAEDLAQNTLVRAYVGWPKIVGANNRDAYVSRIMVNLHRDGRRRHWWREAPTPNLPEIPTHDETSRVDGHDAVRRALVGLNPGQREVVVLRFYLQLSERETAETLKIPAGTVKSRMASALKHLATTVDLADFRDGGTG